MELNEVLKWMMGAGAVTLTAMLTSFLAEHVPAWKTLGPMVKQGVMYAVCAGIALSAWAVLKYAPIDLLEQLKEPFLVVSLAVSALLGNQAWHGLINKPIDKT